MSKSRVTIYAEPRILLRKPNHYAYTIKPVMIKDGVVHKGNKQLSIEGGR